MCNKIVVCVFLNCITSILGGWHLMESVSYDMDSEGNSDFSSREVANVPPTVIFLNNGKGIVEYSNGCTLSFDWETKSDNTIRVALCKDSLENHLFTVCNSEEGILLRENRGNHDVCYLLKSQHYTVEEQNESVEVDITDSEYEFLIKENPFHDLNCYVIKGNVDKDRISLILCQESLEILYGGHPNCQSVFFVKSSNSLHNIPCFLITYDDEGRVLRVNLVKYAHM